MDENPTKPLFVTNSEMAVVKSADSDDTKLKNHEEIPAHTLFWKE